MRSELSFELPGEPGQEGSVLTPVQLPVGLGKHGPRRLKNRFGEPRLSSLAEIAPRKAFLLNRILAGYFVSQLPFIFQLLTSIHTL